MQQWTTQNGQTEVWLQTAAFYKQHSAHFKAKKEGGWVGAN